MDVVYTDFSKAFDRVSHIILYDKLQSMGLHSNFLMWIKSYLSDRICKVIVEGFESQSYIQTSGVPQGSILGPLLFNLFINDVSHCFSKARYLLYADDLKIFYQIFSVIDMYHLQSDLNNLHDWCLLNKLHLI